MNKIFLYLGIQIIILILQLFNSTKLVLFQYYELLLGSLFIIVFFGLFGSILTFQPELQNYSIIFASFYSIWYYITKKITNLINSDSNGVIYYS
jgi:hypothetical protein